MKNQDTILVPLAEGFEEIEAVTIIDVLRRAELKVVSASLGKRQVAGAHGIAMTADVCLDDVKVDELRAIVLPGGLPGATNLAASEGLLALLGELKATGRLTAAICAAPLVLEAAGVLGEGPATCYPGFGDQLGRAEVLSEPRVVQAGSIITSQGPGTSLEFALALVAELVGGKRADELAQAMILR